MLRAGRMPTPQENHSLWNRHLACSLEWCNISVVTELRYTVIANSFRAIAAKRSNADALPNIRDSLFYGVNLKPQISNRLTD